MDKYTEEACVGIYMNIMIEKLGNRVNELGDEKLSVAHIDEQINTLDIDKRINKNAALPPRALLEKLHEFDFVYLVEIFCRWLASTGSKETAETDIHDLILKSEENFGKYDGLERVFLNSLHSFLSQDSTKTEQGG